MFVRPVAGFLLSLAVVMACPSITGANLVRNADFAQTAGTNPIDWDVVDTGQKVSIDQPDGKPAALRVDVTTAAGKSLGQVRQTIKVKSDSRYRFTAEVKSSKAGLALVQLKPRLKRKELDARINSDWSTTEWTTITKEFDTGTADEIQIVCRFNQEQDAVGSSHWFTNVSLVRLDANGQPIIEPAGPSTYAPPVKREPVVPQIAKAGTDQFISPTGAGDFSGKDITNARPVGKGGLQAALDAAGPGNTVHIASGTYDNVDATIAMGGTGPDARITIAGYDTGAGLPVFTSNFSKDNPGKTGKTLFNMKPGVGHIFIRDIQVRAYKSAVVMKGPNVGVEIANVDVTESRDAFSIAGNAIAGDETSGSHDIIIRDCDVKHFTKRAVRTFDGVSNVQITNVHADAGGKEWATEPFAMGFQIIGGEKGVIDKDITFTDCTASNSYHDGGDKYWNADGFATEGAVRNVTWIRCSAFNNTDGGWDLKNVSPKLVDCVGIGNKRNFRFWLKPAEGGAIMENCLSGYSVDYGGHGHDVGIWMLAGGDMTMTRCTAIGDRVSLKVEGKADKPATSNVTLERCVISPLETGTPHTLYAGTELKTNESILPGSDTPAVQLQAPSPDWRGGDTAFNVKDREDIGYQFRQKAK